MGGSEKNSSGACDLRIVISRSAVEDLLRGREFYEMQGEGLGDYFESSLKSHIESLRLYAGVHPRVHGYYRLLSLKFPYAIYYEVAGEEIQVSAVLDCRQNPRFIQSRLSQ